MRKTTIITIITLIILSNINISYASRNIRGRFTESDVPGTDFKEITFSPYYPNDEEERDYYIYLPSGYFVEGRSASYVADRNGRYPFTVYDGSSKKTFTYSVDSIEDPIDRSDKSTIYKEFQLMYDYEKKQVLFNIQTDKVRTIKTPNRTTVSNEANYYIGNMNNNDPYNLSIEIDHEVSNFKIVKSGEFYLLIYISPVNYNDYSTLVEYYGYNFTNNEVYRAYPPKDIYDDNGNYNILIKSDNSQHIFNINIEDIDYRRPSITTELSDDRITLKAEDDFELSYIITYDGKYVDIEGREATYSHPEEVIYNGKYKFIVGDKKGNRTVKTMEIKSGRRRWNTTRYRHAIELGVHDFRYTEELFENIGVKYQEKDKIKMFESILPGYMNGKNIDKFSPDSSITRAEIVAIFCRLNNLPYDNSIYLRSRFTDINDHWARDYIAMGSSKRYVSGYRDRTFKPDNPVSRAEFSEMITKISSYRPYLNAIPAVSNKNFLDIEDHWAEKAILAVTGRDLIPVDSDYFYPDKPMSRGEVVYAINRLYGFNPTYWELAYIKSLYNNYYNFTDINNHQHYIDIIISLVGMYREVVE